MEKETIVAKRKSLSNHAIDRRFDTAQPFKIQGILVKLIPLNHGFYAIVGASDYVRLMTWKWREQRDGYTYYAVRNDGEDVILMHRLIAEPDKHEEVDHEDQNGLHDWRENLRCCFKARNHHNQRIRSDSATGYKGVSKYSNRSDLYRARIAVNGRRMHLGCFKNPVLAAQRYDAAARFYFGEFALVNFPQMEAETAGGNW